MRLVKILLVFVLLGVVVYLYPPFRLAAMVMAGRSPVCTFRQAVKSEEHDRALVRVKDRILGESKKIECDDRGFCLWQTPYGGFWLPKGSDYTLPFNLAEQELKIYGSHELDVKPGDVVLDCGANVGVYTRAAVENGAKVVVAIEPAPENLECLRRNFGKETSEGRVIIYPKGVWDKDEILTLNVNKSSSAADSFVIQSKDSVPGEKLPLTTIDNLVAELKLGKVDLIKMDIEGAEPRALEGGRRTISRFRPRLAMSTYHAPDHPVTIPRIINGIWSGYRVACGPCKEAEGGIRPDVLIFHP
jgi:FkbM family methyltransferase